MRLSNGGPCDHCGRTSTPCWRKGPPEKPCLCNACGARFLVKRCLEGYAPKPQPSTSGPFSRPVSAQRPKSSVTGKRKQREHPRLQLDHKAFQIFEQHAHQAAFSADYYASSATTTEDECGFDGSISEEGSYEHERHHHRHHHGPTTYFKTEEGYYFCNTAQIQDDNDAALQLVQASQPLPNFHRRPRKQARPVACTC